MGSAVKVKEAVKVQVDKWTAVEDLESWRTGLNTLNVHPFACSSSGALPSWVG